MAFSIGLLATSMILLVLIVKAKLLSKKRPPLPPGPPADPLIGHLRLIPSVGQDLFFYNLSKIYGGVLHLRVFGRSIVVLNSVEAATELLGKRSAINSDRPKFPIYELNVFNFLVYLRIPDFSHRVGFKDALVCVGYGKDFRMYRAMLQQYFSKDKSRTHRPIQLREARLLARNLLSMPQRRENLLIRFSTAIIIEITYGHQIVSDDDPYVKIAEEVSVAAANSGPPGGTPVDVFPILKSFPSWFPGAYYAGYARSVRHVVQRLYDYPLARVMEQRAKGKATPSFLATQLDVLEREGPNAPATIEQIQATAGILYVAGAGTTSSTLSFFILAMVLHPECQLRAQEEIDTIIGHERLPEYHDRERLPYVECLLQETLRWNQASPSGMPHRSMDDDVYNGMFIPKGSILIANTRGMTLDEKVYKNASIFDPTRFLPAPRGRGEPYPIGPFGFGRRICAGRYLADDSLWIAITTILSTVRISKDIGPDGKEITPDAIPVVTGITSHPSPFPCRLSPRNDNALFLLKNSNPM